MTHPCLFLSTIQPVPKYGAKLGVCRITGQKSMGVDFNKWVKDTFTDWPYLQPGTIISNEALFCFEEQSSLIQEKTGRDKLQRFRTYSHILTAKDWILVTKADKHKIYDLIISGVCEIVCLTDSGQKHIFFKHRPGFWQLDEVFVKPNIPDFQYLHEAMMELLALGFGQEQVKTGRYYHATILKVGINNWQKIESKLSSRRGETIFDFAAWLMFTDKKESNE